MRGAAMPQAAEGGPMTRRRGLPACHVCLPGYAFQALRFTPDGLLQTLGLVRAEAREAMAPRFRRVALSAPPR